jgi:hypothetical protein|nr:MAG TPA: ATPase [Caudoviricetes sp.]DAX31719.1 MAG TPA: ATPase [Caudoviricetes sp.]
MLEQMFFGWLGSQLGDIILFVILGVLLFVTFFTKDFIDNRKKKR